MPIAFASLGTKKKIGSYDNTEQGHLNGHSHWRKKQVLPGSPNFVNAPFLSVETLDLETT